MASSGLNGFSMHTNPFKICITRYMHFGGYYLMFLAAPKVKKNNKLHIKTSFYTVSSYLATSASSWVSLLFIRFTIIHQ